MIARRFLVLAAVALVGLSACSSQPSPKAVAMDMVETLDVPQDVKDCMSEKIDTGYTSDELESIGDDNLDFNSASADLDAVTPELRAFIEDLQECVDDPTSAATDDTATDDTATDGTGTDGTEADGTTATTSGEPSADTAATTATTEG